MINKNYTTTIATGDSSFKRTKISPEKYALAGTEQAEQIALFIWVSQNLELYPQLKFLFAIPNGGFRTKIESARFRAQGVKKGVSDIFLPVPKGKWFGLWIELKRKQVIGKKDGVIAKEQKEWIDSMRNFGYGALVCNGWEEAKDALIRYVELKDMPRT